MLLHSCPEETARQSSEQGWRRWNGFPVIKLGVGPVKAGLCIPSSLECLYDNHTLLPVGWWAQPPGIARGQWSRPHAAIDGVWRPWQCSERPRGTLLTAHESWVQLSPGWRGAAWLISTPASKDLGVGRSGSYPQLWHWVTAWPQALRYHGDEHSTNV